MWWPRFGPPSLFTDPFPGSDGLGITVGDAYLHSAGQRLADIGYDGLKDLL
ncbi:MAG: hypothetical protein ACRDT6_19150 [Micromonosporaceae bacterium]